MSHEATNWAFKQRGLKPAAKIVLLALADRHNPDFGCFPSKKTIAEDCELSERAVYDQIKILEAMGLLFIEETPKVVRGQFASNRYILGFEADFPVQNLPSANSAVGKNTQPPSAKSAVDRRQNLPTNPVTEPCKRTSKEAPPLVPPAVLPMTAAQPDPDPDKPPPKVRLPSDWALSDADWAYARSQAIPDKVIEDEVRGFHAYWTDRTDRESRKSQRGWEQCWANWCRRIAPRYAARGRMAGPSVPGGYGQGSSIASIVARRRADGAV